MATREACLPERPVAAGVVGAGVMGVGVGVALAAAGIRAVLVDVDEETLVRARVRAREDARAYALFSRSPRPLDEIEAQIEYETDIETVAALPIVIENVTEDWDVKRRVHARLDAICGPEAVVAVNTSAISITRLAAVTSHPSRVLGMHFMNPAQLKPTVELIRGHHTDAATIAYAEQFLAAIGKRAIVVNDSPGFVTNRVMMLTINEAVFCLQERVADAHEIDRLFVECFGHRMGPLETADLIGLDTVLRSIDVIYEAFKDSKYRPAPLLSQMVDAGLLGRKSGRGFFTYGARPAAAPMEAS